MHILEPLSQILEGDVFPISKTSGKRTMFSPSLVTACISVAELSHHTPMRLMLNEVVQWLK